MSGAAGFHDADVHPSVPFAPRAPRPGEVDAASPRMHNSLAALYAQAMMAGVQAAAACDELGELLETRGEHATAALFRQLAITEADRSRELVRKVASRPLPQLSWWHYNWFYNAPPAAVARELVFHLMTPHAALRIALEAGSRVMALYERISNTAGDAEVRAEARELAAAKSRDVQCVRDALATLPAPLAWQHDCNGLWAAP